MICLTIIPLFLVAWFLQNVVHESSHLLAGWLVEGRKPTKMIVWPTIRGGKLYFAYYECGKATKSGSPRLRFIAPLLSSWILMSIFFTLLIINGSLYFFPFFLCSSVDYCVWVSGYIFKRPGTDGLAFRENL